MVTLIRPHTFVEIAAGSTESFTSVGDVGTKLGGRVVKPEQFLTYERLMVGAMASFMFSGETPVSVGRIEPHKSFSRDSRKLETVHGLDKVLIRALPLSRIVLSLLDAQDLMRLVLRECLWLELRSGRKSIHFGWDLYVYFAGGRLSSQFQDAFVQLGMQVESRRTLPPGHRE